MPTLSDLKQSSNTLSVTSYPILEPLNALEVFGNTLQRFGDNYDTSENSHLYRFLLALCGDTGAGRLKKEMLLPRLEQQLENTHFGNLDKLYGNPFGISRLPEEIYSYDPENDILTIEQWNEIRSADSSYRARCLTWMRALMYGPTPTGIKLAVEAATGVDADVVEEYQYLQNPMSGTNFGLTNTINEFIVIPRTASLSPADTRQISRLLDLLKPTNTIGTIYTGVSPRVAQDVRYAAASSTYFNVQRNVTGNGAIAWPAVDPSNGYWISADTANEAPTYAFMNRQESITYLTILASSASSSHIGYFNSDQQQLFSNLAGIFNPYQQFTPDKSYNNSSAPVDLSITWNGGGSSGNNIVVNNNYPLNYFSNNPSIVDAPLQSFWASEEELPGTTEWIEFDFGRNRPINYIHFEITQKPIDWVIEYSTDNATWQEIPVKTDYPVTMSSIYLPSNQNPWLEFDVYFDLVQARYIRVTFMRRTDPFPLPTSAPISFSIDLQNVHLINTIPVVGDFIADSGLDALGNNFTTALITYDASSTQDGDTSTFWQSQPNPSRFAVESLYFDLSTGSEPIDMEWLDEHFMNQIDNFSMETLETSYYNDGTLVDEVYVDPITYGPDMHFYYSNDDTPDWDNKLWTPVPINYTLTRGFHALPSPTMVKYFKIEFTKLNAIPYDPITFPQMPNVIFNRYPLWVTNYFLQPITVQDTIQQTNPINIDPATFGFLQVNDSLVTNYEAVRILQTTDQSPEISQYIQNLLAGDTVDATAQTQLESQIEFSSPIMWQQDLISNLDSTRALSRKAMELRNGVADTGWNAELTLPVSPVPVEASDTDLSQPLLDKTAPVISFPFRCRHNYQVCSAPIDKKIAYIVGVKEVGFYRRDYTAPIDEDIYIETLDDTTHISENDFIQNDWRYVVG